MAIKSLNWLYFLLMFLFGVAFEQYVKYLFPDTGIGFIVVAYIIWLLIWIYSFVTSALIKKLPFLSTKIIFFIIFFIILSSSILLFYPQLKAPTPRKVIFDTYTTIKEYDNLTPIDMYNFKTPFEPMPREIIARYKMRNSLPDAAFIIKYVFNNLEKTFIIEIKDNSVYCNENNVNIYKHTNSLFINDYFKNEDINFKIPTSFYNKNTVVKTLYKKDFTLYCYSIDLSKIKHKYNKLLYKAMPKIKLEPNE